MNQHPSLCPMCDEGQLIEHTHDRQDEIDGYGFTIRGLVHSLCDHCGEYIVAPEQSRQNKRTIIEARYQATVERDQAERLSPPDILRIRKELGITQAQAARVFGGGPSAFSKYEHGDVAPSEGMERLLHLADRVPEAANWLLRRAGLPAKYQMEPPLTHAKVPAASELAAERYQVSPGLSYRVALPDWMRTRESKLHADTFSYTIGKAANDSGAPDLDLALS
ncbi:type II toxin-antitoxin system MqsA family antitoxin [Candidatus Thiodictyon syntrophicum]|jgi:HTH-type transcriptional regulator/antitoxin MqsA|uniref:HTH cro/C1-type domain-containing protein n=1 Tax=Candidatus Thiodictyon syntrophicum TaxID=1166950 RepID=A0A2K8UJI6_9GAMM|nr:type II toxin-antitoxin system MqsA family antitoxin [Candidatus Thiodictyon syntrophicum]AUB85700.1 hypothetical protein THSYN_32960 [Candidatus Thiodictyon syntrophicum]